MGVLYEWVSIMLKFNVKLRSNKPPTTIKINYRTIMILFTLEIFK